METLSTLHFRCQQPLNLSLKHHHFSPSISPFFFKFRPLSSFRYCSIRASQSSSPNPKLSKLLFSETVKPLKYSLIRTSCIAVSVAVFFFSRISLKPLPVFAAAVASSTVDTSEQSSDEVSDEENEKTLEENLKSNPNDVQALQSLLEFKIKIGKLDESIEIVDRLIEIEPEDLDWPILKSNIHRSNEKPELAKLGFEKVLEKKPNLVSAYRGLVMVASQSKSREEELTEMLKRIEIAMEKCKNEDQNTNLKDFKLLIAQIKTMTENYAEALCIYQEIVKEDPTDFRPYLCQAVIYATLKKQDEAKELFYKYRSLVPKDHPYLQFLQ